MNKQRGIYIIENGRKDFWKIRDSLMASQEFSVQRPFNGNLESKNGVEVYLESGDKTGNYLGNNIRIEIHKPLFRKLPKSLKTVLDEAELSWEVGSLPLRFWKDCVVPIFEMFGDSNSESPYDLKTRTKDYMQDSYLGN